jgi:nicotinate-nucleotide adenylyltransferase
VRQAAAQQPQSEESPDKGLILRVEEAVRENLSLERFLHSRSTALFAWDMCKRLQGSNPSLEPELGYLAGIAHDLGKQLNDKTQIKLAKTYGKRISRLEKQKPSLLHGRAAAVLLMERFGVYNRDVLNAVAMHTQAGVGMCPLAKVVYIADKMEVSRDRADPSVRKLALTGNDLDAIFATVVDQTVSSLRSRKLKLSAETLELLQEMRAVQ